MLIEKVMSVEEEIQFMLSQVRECITKVETVLPIKQYNQEENEELLLDALNNCIDLLVKERYTIHENETAVTANEKHQSSHYAIQHNAQDQDQNNFLGLHSDQCLQNGWEVSNKKQVKSNLEEIDRLQQDKQTLFRALEQVKDNIKYMEIDMNQFAREKQLLIQENELIKQENQQIKYTLKEVCEQIILKEDNFNCIVEGLQMMRDEILGQIDELQNEMLERETQFKKELQQQNMTKLNYLESKLKEKYQQIKHLSHIADSLQERKEGSNLHRLKVNNQLLIQENSRLKSEVSVIQNKNMYSQQSNESQQKNDTIYKYNQSYHSIKANDYLNIDKENTHPNLQSSEISFKPSEDQMMYTLNSLQFQSKQFNLINQRNSDLQKELDSSLNLIKDLQGKIYKLESLQLKYQNSQQQTNLYTYQDYIIQKPSEQHNSPNSLALSNKSQSTKHFRSQQHHMHTQSSRKDSLSILSFI